MKKLILAGCALGLLAACATGPVFEPDQLVRPEGMPAATGERSELVAKGEALWNDKSLGTSGLACASCHVNNLAQFKETYKNPYPHEVAMAKNMGGLEKIDADGMVQLCMLVPMKGKELAWDSEDLAALTAYVEDISQKDYIEKSK